MRMMRKLMKEWRQFNLAKQFILTGSVVVIISMAVMGTWVAKKIEEDVTHNTAGATALYVNSFVAPLIQELSEKNSLSVASRKALDHSFSSTELGKRVMSFKIWLQDGLIVYSSYEELIGRKFQPTDNLKRAWSGVVSAEFNKHVDEEDVLEKATGVPLLEVYAPVRKTNSDQVIAVAEFYTAGDSLQVDLFQAKLQSWLVVALLTLMTIAALSGIVLRGSRTIDRQRRALEQRVFDLSNLLAQNEELRGRVEQASERTAEINEKFLRKISAELHDGPAQLLGLALLRLDALNPHLKKIEDATINQFDSTMETLRTALSDALREIRNLSAGLALPEIEKLSLEETLRIAATTHEKRTSTAVEYDIAQLPKKIPLSIKICLYRFSQEALNNSFLHAGGKGQVMRASANHQELEVQVQDSGEGFDPSEHKPSENRLGITGMRDRIETLGGVFKFESCPGNGTCLTATFPTSAMEVDDER